MASFVLFLCGSQTLIGQEVQHGLQQEGQVAYGEAGVTHAAGGVHQLVQETHLNGSPASVRACMRDDTNREVSVATRLAGDI